MKYFYNVEPAFSERLHVTPGVICPQCKCVMTNKQYDLYSIFAAFVMGRKCGTVDSATYDLLCTIAIDAFPR